MQDNRHTPSRWFKAALVPLLLAVLAACATPFNAKVQRFQSQLPAPAGQSFFVVADDPALVAAFADVGISGFANIVAAIKLAKQLHYGADDVIVTVATDSASLYDSERNDYQAKHFGSGFDEVNAGEIFGSCLTSVATDHVVELTDQLRRQVFNLGYYTWVEQQGVSVEDFERRRSQSFWDGIVDSLPEWDRLIEEFNAEVAGTNTFKAGS